MTPYTPLTGIEIYQGNCCDVLARLDPASVQCCVTSPPYWGLRDYGIPPSVWGGDPGCEHEWNERRVFACGRNDGGRDIGGRGGNYKDDGPHKQQCNSGQFCQRCNAWSGNLGLEPTPELFVAHIVEVFAAVWRVLKDDGTLWLNLGDSYNNAGSSRNGEGLDGDRRGGATGADGELGYKKRDNRYALREFGIKPKDLVGIPWACAFALRSAGWYLRSDIIWHKPNPMPESVTDRPTKSHEYIFLLSKSQRYYYDADAIKEAMEVGSLERYEYAFGGAKSEALVEANKDGIGQRTRPVGDRETDGKRSKRTVWRVPTSPTPEAHFATFPPKLIEPCILAGCPEGGVVLDPFSGAGTTAMVCKNLGRKFVGCELNPEYIAIAEKRIGRQEVLF